MKISYQYGKSPWQLEAVEEETSFQERLFQASFYEYVLILSQRESGSMDQILATLHFNCYGSN